MVINLIVIAAVLGLGGLWLSRGFFSALINLLAVILAGGVAFAVFEKVAYLILDQTDDRGFMQGAAWAIGLAGPFVVALGLFRLILDGLIRANVKVNPAVNYIGGGICGAGAGLLSVGIAVISIGCLRMDAGLWKTNEDDNTSGYLNINYDSTGAIKKGEDLWIPADKIVAAFYGSLSKTTFSNETNLGDLYPDLAYVPATLRFNYGMGKGRNTTRAKDFEVVKRYTVGKGSRLKPDELLADKWYQGPQRVTLFDSIDGSDGVTQGSYIEGFVVKFNSGARELGGDSKIAIGNAQIRLLARNEDGEMTTLFPIAVAAQAEAAKPTFQRFRYDAKEVFIASVGGASAAFFGFDFIMPKGYTPYALYVKNIRVMIDDNPALSKPAVEYATPVDRDTAIASGAIGAVGGGGSGPMDTTNVQIIRYDPAAGANDTGISVTPQLPQTMNKMVIRSMTCTEDNRIVDGDQQFSPEDLKNFAQEKSLRVDSFENGPDTAIVQVDVGLGTRLSWLNHPAGQDDTKAPVLVDTAGIRYEPIGFIHKDAGSDLLRIVFHPSNPFTNLKGLPVVTPSKPKDTLKLIFRVSSGVKLKYFGVGDKAIVEWRQPVEAIRNNR